MGFRFVIASICAVVACAGIARAEHRGDRADVRVAFAPTATTAPVQIHWQVPMPQVTAPSRPGHAARKQQDAVKTAAATTVHVATVDLQSGYQQLFPPSVPRKIGGGAAADVGSAPERRLTEFWTVFSGPGAGKAGPALSAGPGLETPRNLLVALRAGF
jgi:hypothetical protein